MVQVSTETELPKAAGGAQTKAWLSLLSYKKTNTKQSGNPSHFPAARIGPQDQSPRALCIL